MLFRFLHFLLIIVLSLVIHVNELSGQIDSLILPITTVDASPLRYNEPGSYTEIQDTFSKRAFSAFSVADLLSSYSGVYIKSYGRGALATSSLRGSGASQTAVVWNGIPLQSPMLGLLDLSRLPISFMDELIVNYGGTGASWGSGAIGGVIALRTKIPEKQGFQGLFQSSIGSWGFQNFNSNISFRKNKFSSITRLVSTNAINDFRTPLGKNSNASFNQKGFIQELYYTPSVNQTFSVSMWLQKEIREIPPTSVQSKSLASQDDYAARWVAHWRWVGNTQVVQMKAGYFEESMIYKDELILLNAENKFKTFHSELEYSVFFTNKIQWQTNIINSKRVAKADGYSDAVNENISSVFSGFRVENSRINGQLGIRKEWQDGTAVPVIPSLGIDFHLSNNWIARFKWTRFYRLPTLNDLFWHPGGNIDLIPESGWGQEIGFSFGNKRNFRWASNIYHRLINNWILWSVNEGNSFWSSNNIAAVRSYGSEQRIKYQFVFSKVALSIQLAYDFTRSINERSVKKPKIVVGEQLVYVPIHQGSIHVGLSKGRFNWVYRHRYTGKVYGISESVSAYQLGWLQLEYHFDHVFYRKGPTMDLYFQSDNVWNTQYKVIERRFMPGRSYQLGLNFKL